MNDLRSLIQRLIDRRDLTRDPLKRLRYNIAINVLRELDGEEDDD